ncbi:phosphoribosyl-AMP cyclohydrolase [Vagococcus elongatus]|uniref:Phosphoribosyl-AMP cyclohydrolase n=1 Tax=Vagococcus elongatus TaxID=180344 RepID=A0A430ALX7_9ENTE|nr:phosphoribosyl-AMP cyclohydrolase [Vagococcus elongatus]RSU09076.1 phosphoribosyl-AMP cyclohydrolase [Vagococcus elongatus]
MINKELLEQIDFEKQKGLVPAVVQEAATGEVLMLAYMTKESLLQTMETQLATYYSRSRQELWVKGATSGHYQKVKQIVADCDYDTLLIKVTQIGSACHTGEKTCFFNQLYGGENK